MDWEEYLDDRGLDYITQGKNTSDGWISINCPYCDELGDPDPSQHLGINPEDKGHFSCWRCKSTGDSYDLIRTLEDCSFPEAKRIYEEFSEEGTHIEQPKQKKERSKTFQFPHGVDEIPEPRHTRYLRKRGVSEEDEKTYQIRYGHILGPCSHRVVVPITENHEVVSYVARDITGLSEERYKQCPDRESTISPKEVIFGLDLMLSGKGVGDKKSQSVSGKGVLKTGVILEGVFDAMRMGFGSVATLGTSVSAKQVLKLVKAPVSRWIIIFDPEEAAQQQAHELAFTLAAAGKEAMAVCLDGGKDVGSLSDQELRELKEILGV